MKTRVELSKFDPSAGFDRGRGVPTMLAWQGVKCLFFLNPLPWPSFLRCWLLRLFGAHIGKGVVTKPRVNIHFPWKLKVGDNVWLGEESFVLNFESIIIGSNVCLSQRAFLCGGNHDFRDPAMSYRNAPITVEDGAWVGAQVFVGPGVTVGTDAVISAGSVLTKNAEPGMIYAGNPAKIVGKRWRDETPNHA